MKDSLLKYLDPVSGWFLFHAVAINGIFWFRQPMSGLLQSNWYYVQPLSMNVVTTQSVPYPGNCTESHTRGQRRCWWDERWSYTFTVLPLVHDCPQEKISGLYYNIGCTDYKHMNKQYLLLCAQLREVADVARATEPQVAEFMLSWQRGTTVSEWLYPACLHSL